jgi:flagellar hook-length control protein FliK
MIAAAGKVKTESVSLLNLDTTTQKSTSNSFSQILQNIIADTTTNTKDAKSAISLLENLGTQEQGTKTSDKKSTGSKQTDKTTQADESALLLLLNAKEMPSQLSTSALKKIIKEAKSYIASKIDDAAQQQNKTISKMPKTLKGLLDLAKSLNIDVSKISLTKTITTDASKQESASASKTLLNQETLSQSTTKTTAKNQIPQETITANNVTQTIIDAKQNGTKTLQTTDTTTQTTKALTQEAPSIIVKTVQKHSTQEIVQGKSQKNTKTTTAKNNNTHSVLSKLLNPKQSSEISSTVASLLKNDSKQNQSLLNNSSDMLQQQTAVQNTTVQSTQDLSVKIQEGKQTVKYLAHDVKQAIENYKPPFTKIKVALHPQKFGEVDLTVVQRGKNVHVNITSNSDAINTLAQNATDLKTQLAQNGMNNATLNFSSSANLSDGSSQQQSQQQQRHAKNQYEQNSEVQEESGGLDTLEIIIPQYI